VHMSSKLVDPELAQNTQNYLQQTPKMYKQSLPGSLFVPAWQGESLPAVHTVMYDWHDRRHMKQVK